MDVQQGFIVEYTSDPKTAFTFAAGHGFDYVELNMAYTFERRRVDPAAVRRLAAEHGLDLVVHLPYHLDPGSPHEHVRQGACREIEAAIDTAIEFGAEKGVFHATSLASPDRWDHAHIRDCIYESVQRIDAYASKRDFTACAENLKTAFFDGGDFPDLFAQTDAAACLDTGHAYATGHDATAQADLLREHPERFAHIHLNETRLDEQDEHLPVGLGQIDFGVLADTMRDIGWSGTCTHEVFSFDHEYAAYGKDIFNRRVSENGG